MKRLVLAVAMSLALLTPSSAAGRPPVVMVVFDEFPTISLLDAHGRVDAKRYPSFGALARDGTWFPNATASVDETGRALETLLTARTPERFWPRTSAANPRNLFTLLRGRYRVVASEEATALCPRRLCPHSRLQDAGMIKHELAGGRPQRFRRWLGSIRRGRPTLYFKHVLLPHVPLRYLPSGRRYGSRPHEAIPGIVEAFHNSWLVQQAYQRHLLQLGFTDRLLGELLRHLRAGGLYDRSLIVVTADNGEGFGIHADRHEITRRNAVNIALTPLFMKLPGQRRGRIVGRHVRTLDVLPTIAHVLHVPLHWRVQGRSALGPASRRIPSSTLLIQRSGRRFRLGLRTLRRQAQQRLRAKLRLFGSSLYGIGPHREVLGTPLSTWPSLSARHTRARLNGLSAFRTVRRGSGLVPSFITGRITNGARRGSRPLAFVVNGWVVATAPTFHLRRRRGEFFSAMVPEEFLHDGSNDVRVFAITPGRAGVSLVRVF